MTGPVAEFAGGARLLARAIGIVLRTPRLAVLGAVPALLTALLLLAGLVTLAFWVDNLAGWLTPFADDWAEAPRGLVRFLVGLALLGTAAVVGVVTFAALTLLVGGPFYERIAVHVDGSLGGGGADRAGRADRAGPAGFAPAWWRGAGESAAMIAISVGCMLPTLVLGFVPVVGQTVVPVFAACVGGWLLTVELTGVAFSLRGLSLRERHRALRARRMRSLGFGVPTYLLCTVPLLAVVVMPAAVAGATLLAREVLQSRSDGMRGS